MSANAPIRKHMGYKKRKMMAQAAIAIFLALGSVVMIIPFLWMISTAFDMDAMYDIVFPPRFWPSEPSLQPFRIAFTNVPMIRYIFNTLLVAVGNISASIFSAICAGYALSKIRFKGSAVVLVLALSTLMIPGEVTIVPRFFLFMKLGLVNSYLAFWLPAFAAVMGTFFTRQYMVSIPDSLRESARLDGAGELRIALQIYMPLCGALIATLAVLQFLGVWNDFLWPMIILVSPSRYTLQLGIAMFSMNQGGVGAVSMPAIRMACTAVSIIPVLILYLFLQRFIVESIALSGVKQ